MKSGVICAGTAMMTFTGEAKTENPGWLVPCVKNLVSHRLEYHDNVDPEVDVILDRYNLPDIRGYRVDGYRTRESVNEGLACR